MISEKDKATLKERLLIKYLWGAEEETDILGDLTSVNDSKDVDLMKVRKGLVIEMIQAELIATAKLSESDVHNFINALGSHIIEYTETVARAILKSGLVEITLK